MGDRAAWARQPPRLSASPRPVSHMECGWRLPRSQNLRFGPGTCRSSTPLKLSEHTPFVKGVPDQWISQAAFDGSGISPRLSTNVPDGCPFGRGRTAGETCHAPHRGWSSGVNASRKTSPSHRGRRANSRVLIETCASSRGARSREAAGVTWLLGELGSRACASTRRPCPRKSLTSTCVLSAHTSNLLKEVEQKLPLDAKNDREIDLQAVECQ